MELRNGPEVNIDMWIVVFDLRKGYEIHRKEFRMFPEMFGHENTLSGPKRKAHEVFGKRKRKFCGVQGPDARNPGVWPWSPRRTLAFRVKPTLWRLLLQVSIPRLNIYKEGQG